MAVGVGEGLLAFLSGVQEGGEKIDEKLALQMKAIKDSNPDENLKSKYAAEFAKFEKDKELIASINALGGSDFSGISTAQGQVLAGGYKSIEEYQKALTLNPDLRHSMPKIGEEPVYTPSTYGVSNRTEDGKSRSTVSKAFNSLFRPEVFEKNEAYADANPATEGSLTFGDDSSATTYRRGKSDNLSEKEVTSLESSSARNLAQNREKTKDVIKLDKNGDFQSYKLQRNDDGSTGSGAKALGGALRPELYEGYDVIFATPWQDPTQDKKDSVKEYTQELWTNKNGDLTGKDGFVMEGDKQLTYKTKIIKTNEKTDVVDIGGGKTLIGWKYLQQDLIEATVDKGTSDMQNKADKVEQFIAMYNNSQVRRDLMNPKLIEMGLPEGEMTELAAGVLLDSFDSYEQNVNTGSYANTFDLWAGVEDASQRKGTFRAHATSDISNYTVEHIPEMVYYKKLEKPYGYLSYIDSAVATFSTVNQLSISTSTSVVEVLSKLAIKDKKDIVNPYVFDRDAVVWTREEDNKPFTVDNLIDFMTKHKNSKEGKDFTWIELARDLQKDIISSRKYGEEKWWLSSDNKD